MLWGLNLTPSAFINTGIGQKNCPKWDPLETAKLRIWAPVGHLMTSPSQLATTMLTFAAPGATENTIFEPT